MELKLQILQRTPTTLLVPLSLHQQCSTTTSTSSSIIFPNPSSNPNDSPFHLLRQVHTRYRRWDSNAENFRAQNFNFNPQNDDEDDDDDDDDDDDWSGVLEEFINGAWIFPVFRSFGWMLPAIISSLLLTSGPKAFLMALAIPLGQSALSLAFQKISGRKPSKPKRKTRKKTKPRARYARNVKLKEEEVETEGTRKGKMGYQTWVAGEDVQVDKDSQDSPSFGGWDELDRRTKFNKGSARKSAQNADGPQRSKLSRSGRRSEMPLLLRLLIAVFPFLGSWVNFF